jgi:hypothetical protein
MKRLRPLEHWDCGFESHSEQGCVYVFILCLCSFVYMLKALRRADPPPKAS